MPGRKSSKWMSQILISRITGQVRTPHGWIPRLPGPGLRKRNREDGQLSKNRLTAQERYRPEPLLEPGRRFNAIKKNTMADTVAKSLAKAKLTFPVMTEKFE